MDEKSPVVATIHVARKMLKTRREPLICQSGGDGSGPDHPVNGSRGKPNLPEDPT
jgi:hypothetical protein